MKKKVKRRSISDSKVVHKPYLLLVFLLFVFVIAFLGNVFMGDGAYSEWYQSVKPSIAPPSWTFGVVWMILYFLIAVSLYFAWISSKNAKQRRNIFLLYGINLIANALWTYFFFSLKNPLVAFFDLIIIWLTALCMIVCIWRIDRKASWMLVPYFLWVTFAGILNILAYMNSI